MFGANDLNQQSNDDPAMLDNVKQLVREPADSIAPATSPMVPPTQPSSPFTPTTVPAAVPADQPQQDPVTEPEADEHRAEPAIGFSSTSFDDPPADASTFIAATDTDNDQSQPSESPVIQSTSAPVQEEVTTVDPSGSNLVSTSLPQAPDQNHLAGLKQQAIGHLESLSDHVEGTPEEMFKTTMMMIQANDNHTLLEKALEAAKSIEDDKIRAKAMLDVINEINYFSQENSPE